MALTHSPSISTNGLILSLDAENQKSVGNGVQWYNLVAPNGVTRISSPTIGTKGGATCYIFDNAGDRFQSTPTGIPNPQNYLTLEAWIYPEPDITSGDRMNIVRANSGGNRAYLSYNKSNNKISNYWYGTSNQGYHETVSYTPGRNVWQHFCCTWDGTTIRQYVNYENKGSAATTSQGQTFGTEIQIGWEGDGRQFSGGIGLIRIYNRALTDDEVKYNFNSHKERFGL